jgi:hypothetical protein
LDKVPGTPPSDVVSDKEAAHSLQPNLECTPDTNRTEGDRAIVGVEIVGGIAHDKATGLYNNQYKYLEQ